MTIGQNCSPSLIAPQKLLSEERLDIAVKWMFFRHLLKGDDPDSERIYRWHIYERTGGQEPRGWKETVEDYVMVCKSLLKDMLKVGFNSEFPLEYGQNGKLRDGAHRLACSLLLGLDIYRVIVPAHGNMTWGENWFVRHGVAPEDLERIKTTWKQLKHGQFI
jgi:hypothetical protein